METVIHELDEADQACPACGGNLEEWTGQEEQTEENEKQEEQTTRQTGRHTGQTGCLSDTGGGG